jgi:hypothetical protein
MADVVNMNDIPSIEIDGKTYPLSTKLRVAYKIQGQHSHKPYTEIFSGIDSMTLEQQVNMLYAAFECANPEDAKVINSQKFLDMFLDNYNLAFMMECLQKVISGILGKDISSSATNSADATAQADEGN